MANRFKELRIKNGYKSQKALADVLYVNQTAVSQWEQGRTFPDSQKLQILSELYGVSVDYLLGRDVVESNPARIPVLGSIPAGIPMSAIEDIVGWEDIPADWISGNREYFALRVDGDSMYPEYLQGDTIIVRKQPTFENGDDCVVYVNGYNATLKKLYREPDGSIRVVPINPNYPPRTYSPTEVAELPIACAGVVVELRRTKKK